jgi:cellulose synthase/poly-beta-1,6-N-acetylglucosamine synthase-like glycosyltransferase
MTSTLAIFLDMGALLLLGLTLPLTLELLVLSIAAIFPGRRLGDEPSASGFRLAVIVPAHNEQKLIATCVQSLLLEQQSSVEVFVVAHNCNDLTAELAADAGARVLALHGAGGKGLALDYGFRHALALGADAVLVVDADSIVSRNLIDAVSRAIRGGAQAVQTRYQVANATANLRTRLAALGLLGMNVLRPRGRSRLGLSCGIFGNGFALSAETLRRVPYTANSLVEDLEYHLRLLEAGIFVEFLDHATVFGEMPEHAPAAASQRARWEGGRALLRWQWTMPLFRRILGGEARMIEPLLDLLALPLTTHASLLVIAGVLHCSWLQAYAFAGMLLVVLYVVVAASLSEDPADALYALAAVPAYLPWKLLTLPQSRLASRKDALWIRTPRNAEAIEKAE